MKSAYFDGNWTVKSFVARVATACHAEDTASGIMQEAFRFGYAQAKKHGNLTLLSIWFTAIKERNWRHGMALSYLRESIGNLAIRSTKDKDGKPVFILSKDDADKPLEFHGVPSRAWYETSDTSGQGNSFVWDNRLKALIKGAVKAGMSQGEIQAALHEAADNQVGEIVVAFQKKAA